MNPDSNRSHWQGRTALVTGASAGIGEVFAQALAARGCHLVLTARRLDRLDALATQLRERHGIKVTCIAADLAETDAVAKLCAAIDGAALAVDVLINNAGYGVPGAYQLSAWPTHAQFLQVMVTAPCELAHRLLPGMRARGRGAIINVASLAGLVPGSAGSTLYGASKAFLVKFSQSLSIEQRDRGIRVSALCPGFTFSEFHDVTGARSLVSKMPRWLWMDAKAVVEQGLSAIERGQVICVPGRINKLLKFIAKHLPDALALRIVAGRSAQFRVID